MRVPIDWLHEYCAPELSVGELASVLALTGTEVERIERHGVTATDGFVVGRVLERTKHPDADRLSVCLVDLGTGEPSQIVCGAPNVEAGLTVGVARPGAVMPDGTAIKTAKLRGQASSGMILSERELQISAEHDGIMVLSPALEPGTPLGEVIPLGTDVLVLEITPNRPDCLGIYGVAREVHAATGAALAPPPWEVDPGTLGELEGVEIVNAAGPELNPRFTARIFQDVTVGPSPVWLKARLMAAGMRPISNVVDITNYVMLATGQPMHAFDLDRVAGRRLTVRRARAAEPVQTLDGQTRTLDPEVVLIEDAEGPTSIAGVMGGARSEVSDTTTTVLSEVATWSGPNIHVTSLKLALHSEAASRNAKGLQPEQTLWAQALATRLLTEIAGATVAPGTLDLGGPGPAPVTLPLRTARMTSLLGVEVGAERSAEVLGALGFATAPTATGLDVTVPALRRADVTREVDLIEEVARLAVLGELPATLPPRRASYGRLSPRQRLRRRAADLLTGQGFHEVVGWSFASPEQNARLRLDHEAIRLSNPMSNEQSLLRTTLLGSVLDIAARNRAQGAGRIAIFEMGPVYRPELIGPDAEDVHLLGVLTGPVRPASWRDQHPPPADFFAAKAAAHVLLDGLGIGWELVAGQPLASLHPSASAAVHVAGERVGFVAEVHPLVAAEWDLDDQTVAVLAINLDRLPLPEVAQYADLTSFPEVREDLAVLLADTVTAAELTRVIMAAGRPLVQAAEVFDVYRDAERLGPGQVSLAVRLSFRAADRTLTDAEVAVERTKIVAAIERELGAASVPKYVDNVAVLGASGYAGALTTFLLNRHPKFAPAGITSRSDAGQSLDQLYPRYRIEMMMRRFEDVAEKDFDAVVVAYPHMAAAPVVKHFYDRGIKVVDLSADFRLRDLATYEEWYGIHPVPELIPEAVYGLPELYREQIGSAQLVANPGCYPTATILALAPLARAGLIQDLVVDAKSGVSGAGRTATDATHFVTVDENVTPYGVPRHRHTPEIEQELAAAGNPVTMTFTPHLLPLDQGELVSCYVTLTDPGVSETELRALYGDFYVHDFWVEVIHQYPGARAAHQLPGVRDVRNTNYCRVSVHKDERTGRAIVFAAIDNLWKGTASQAIQNLNLMFGYDEDLGLES